MLMIVIKQKNDITALSCRTFQLTGDGRKGMALQACFHFELHNMRLTQESTGLTPYVRRVRLYNRDLPTVIF